MRSDGLKVFTTATGPSLIIYYFLARNIFPHRSLPGARLTAGSGWPRDPHICLLALVASFVAFHLLRALGGWYV